MVTKTFGAKLKQFRLQSHDPHTGRYLTQEKLGALIGEELGNGYSAQAASDWERNQSQIHKDHRNVLITLIHILYDHGGLSTLEEADGLLAVGNYRRLNPQELSEVFNNTLGIKHFTLKSKNRMVIYVIAELKARIKNIVFHKIYRCLVGGLALLMTWFGISPMMTWLFQDRAGALRAAFLFTVTGITSPLIISWIGKKNNDPIKTDDRRAHFLLRYTGCIFAFNISSLSIFSLMLACFHLNLYHWSKLFAPLISALPVLLTFSYARQDPRMQRSLNAKKTMEIVGQTLFCFALPLLLSLQVFLFQDFFLSNPLGPLVTFLEILGAGSIFYHQHRRLHI